MTVDRTWLLLTETYAIVAMLSLLTVLVACGLLVLKVMRTVKQTKARVKGMIEQQRRTATAVKSAAVSIGKRTQRTAEMAKGTVRRVAGRH